jgi:hypothetical protein
MLIVFKNNLYKKDQQKNTMNMGFSGYHGPSNIPATISACAIP